MRKVAYVAGVAAVLLTLTGAPALAAPGTDTLVTVGSPAAPFSQNKQNEPALAVDAQPPERARGRRERQHRHGGV